MVLIFNVDHIYTFHMCVPDFLIVSPNTFISDKDSIRRSEYKERAHAQRSRRRISWTRARTRTWTWESESLRLSLSPGGYYHRRRSLLAPNNSAWIYLLLTPRRVEDLLSTFTMFSDIHCPPRREVVDPRILGSSIPDSCDHHDDHRDFAFFQRRFGNRGVMALFDEL